ncbi:MAG: hypothetical protein IPL71_02130 [Anaerolineales bacterium]|uniref:hypothetical protein n=1 Tax=Candidatus Villigracilis proximus TaxID=3140683 RepID=UPI0031362929|nr:hypothetical protein [Anaerolineales bacterium]
MNKPMDQSGKNSNLIKDSNRLADFTDQVLNGKLEKVESNVDGELLGLEETILRLKSSIPSTPLDQAAIKQMQVRLKTRIQREAREVQPPFWKKWIEIISRPQLGMAFAVALVLVVLVIFSPSLFTAGPAPLTGTALAPSSTKNILIVSIAAGVMLIFFWMKRPK